MAGGIIAFHQVLTRPDQSRRLMPNRYGLHVKFIAHRGKRDALLEDLLAAAEGIGMLPGCQLYLVSVSPTEPDSVFVTEVWESATVHDASLDSESVRQLVGSARPLIASSERTVIQPVGGRGLGA